MFSTPKSTTVESAPATRSFARMIRVPLNRVEGDLEIRAELRDSVVADAWSAGTMYRGFENMLTGRAALDGLVITPRVCGICSTAHLTAAVGALESITGVTPPPDALRIRNAALMAELLQSDVRQTILMFMPDFTNSAYTIEPFYDEAVRRYLPLQGASAIDAIRETKRIVEIVAILGGQWPHSAYMVPGGVLSLPSAADLTHCRCILTGFKSWYERRVLGCAIERWQAVRKRRDLEQWLEESDDHRRAEVGCLLRLGRAVGLDRIGAGPNRYLSVGGLPMPPGSAVRVSHGDETRLIPAGYANGRKVKAFKETEISEDVSHSWSGSYSGMRHPRQGETRPSDPLEQTEKYSWAKAPRYAGEPVETGPLAERIVAGDALFRELCDPQPNALVRQLARLTRPAALIPAMERWLEEIAPDQSYYADGPTPEDGEGAGLTEAARGALGHWLKLAGGKIQHYQIITPTAWNGSPRDEHGRRGPWEQALIGTRVRDPENPVELGHVIRSFDPCLVCTVHAVTAKGNAKAGMLIR